MEDLRKGRSNDVVENAEEDEEEEEIEEKDARERLSSIESSTESSTSESPNRGGDPADLSLHASRWEPRGGRF